MIAVWLYDPDGRAVACVYVTVPQPPAVTYRGILYTWFDGRYQEASTPYAAQAADPKDHPPTQGDT